MTEEEVIELLKGEFDLDVVNFEKYHPAGKTFIFFKLKPDWFLDPKLHGLKERDRLMYILLLSLRASSVIRLRSISTRWIRARCAISGPPVIDSLVRLWKRGLIFLEISHRIEKNREEKNRVEETHPTTPKDPSKILPELQGIEDEFFREMTHAAQKSWVDKYGLEMLRSYVAVYYSDWKSQLPRDRYGHLKSKVLHIANRLQKQKEYKPRERPQEKDWKEIAKEQEEERKNARARLRETNG